MEQTQLLWPPLPLLQLPQLLASILEATFMNIPHLLQHPSCRGDANANAKKRSCSLFLEII
jgi:hypothetical protein